MFEVIAQKVGYTSRCNFRNWIQNLGATPIRIWAKLTSNLLTQGSGVVQAFPSNRP